ncbi:hypothetical protein C8F01DRAFT_962752, partial [Mycena amicta]
GVFGRVKHYYGVFEAQNRGSLHMHILIWLEGALSPKLVQEKAMADAFFKNRLFAWLESIIKHELPPNTESADRLPKNTKKQCLMGRPLHPDDPQFTERWPQYLRDILDNSDQVHTHNDSCFKKTPFSKSSLTPDEQDILCRYNYPAKLFAETFMDEDGKLCLKRIHAWVVGFNPTASGGLQCNSDAKYVGSGPLAMALSIYMTLYTAKSTLDSPVIMSALAAATKALNQTDPQANTSLDDERCRRLLLKTLNQVNGRRELSGQQVACSLLGISNHVTDVQFTVFYWSRLLTW